MKKIMLNILVAIACILCGVNVYAHDFKVDGIYYNVYNYDDLTLEVTFNGANVNSHVGSYSGSVIVPDTLEFGNTIYKVVRIGDDAFYGSFVTSIILPNTITSIGKRAFQVKQGWDDALYSLVIPADVSSIGSGAFAYFTKVFLLSINPPTIGSGNMDQQYYVTDKSRYMADESWKDAKNMVEMITISPDTIIYNGEIPEFACRNNLAWMGYEFSATFNDISDSNVGTHKASINITYSNGLDLNAEVPFEYTILPAPLTVEVNSVSRVYGDDNPKFTYSSVTGFVNNESMEGLGGEVVLTTEATNTSDVGEYPITGTIIDMPNYSATFLDGKLSVTKASAGVKFVDCNRIYGDKNPNFNVKYEGLKNNEKSIALTTPHTFATDAVKSSDVGEYVVAVSGGAAKNYDFVAYEDGVLHIDKRELIVTANNYSRKYNEDNPTFDFTYSNFASFDDKDVLEVEPRIYCSATPKSPAGDYPIIVSGGEDNNYDFRYNVGNLTVEQIILNFKKEKNQTYFTNTPQCPELVVDGNLEIENIDDILDAYQEYGSNEDGRGWVNISLNSVVNVGEYRFDLSVNNDSLFADATTYLTILKAYPNLKWNQYIDKMKIGDRIILEYSTTVGKPVVICDYDILGVGYDTELERYYLEALKEGTTDVTMYVKETNNYYESERITKTVCVEPVANQHDIINTNIRVYGSKNSIYISNKADSDFVYVYDVNGYLLYSGKEKIVPISTKGLYIVKVENQIFKVVI